jgi:hypothetical protein
MGKWELPRGKRGSSQLDCFQLSLSFSLSPTYVRCRYVVAKGRDGKVGWQGMSVSAGSAESVLAGILEENTVGKPEAEAEAQAHDNAEKSGQGS